MQANEAEVRHHGERLGEVGGRIVAEVLLGLIDGDPNSYLNAGTDWKPQAHKRDILPWPISLGLPE